MFTTEDTEDTEMMDTLISRETKLVRTIHPEVRIVDAQRGIVDYVASDETLDSYREVIRADGWRFNRFEKNAPFVDSHDYYSIDKVLGQVIGWEIQRRQLVERVRYAIDVEENLLARFAFSMVLKGYLKAVSVGFLPVDWVSKFDDPSGFLEELQDLGMSEADNVRRIFRAQEQIELSQVVIGANGNALVKAIEDGAVEEKELAPLVRMLMTPQRREVGAENFSEGEDSTDPGAPGASAAAGSEPTLEREAQRRRICQRLAILLNL